MSYLSPNFYIRSIHIGTISEASCFNLGNNLPIGFQNYKKHNQGFGTVDGDNNDISDIKSMLKDSNVIDMINGAEEEELPDWVKHLIVSKLSKD
jgi:hypothetical protein